MQLKRVLRVFSLAAVVAIVLAACGVSTQQQGGGSAASPTTAPAASGGAASGNAVTIRWRTRPSDAAEQAVYQALNDAANQQLASKNIKAVYDPGVNQDYEPKLKAELSAGTAPDVVWIPGASTADYVAAGQALDIKPFLDKDTSLKVTDFYPQPIAELTHDGKIYGLPRDVSTMVTYYNADLFKAAGIPNPKELSDQGKWNWDTLLESAKKLTDAKSGRFGLAYSYSDYYYHAALQNAFGGRVFDPGPKPVLNAPENVKALELLMRWFTVDGILPAEPSTALITSLFNGGKAAMVFSGPWFLGEIAKNIDYGLALLPTIDEAGGKPMRPWMTVEGVYVTAPSQNKDAAYDFAKYLTDTPQAKVMAVEGRQTPENKAVYSDPAVSGDKILSAFRKQVEVAVPMPNLPEMTMVWSPATTAMNTIVKKAATPKAAMDQAQKAVERDVAALRKK